MEKLSVNSKLFHLKDRRLENTQNHSLLHSVITFDNSRHMQIYIFTYYDFISNPYSITLTEYYSTVPWFPRVFWWEWKNKTRKFSSMTHAPAFTDQGVWIQNPEIPYCGIPFDQSACPPNSLMTCRKISVIRHRNWGEKSQNVFLL